MLDFIFVAIYNKGKQLLNIYMVKRKSVLLGSTIMNGSVKINDNDYGNILNTLQRNDYLLKNIIVCYAVPNPQRHICTVGENQFDRFFTLYKEAFL